MLRSMVLSLAVCCGFFVVACSRSGTEGGPSPADAVASGANLTAVSSQQSTIERKCVPCHTSKDSLSGLDFSSRERVQRLAPAMAAAIRSGHMPPWLLDNSCNEYVDSRSMTTDEQARVLAWLDRGAPAAAPEPSDATAEPNPMGSAAPTWDLTLRMPVAYTPKVSPDDYRCFILHWPTTEPRYVTAAQFVPDKRAIVHHMLAYAVDKADEAHYLGLEADGPGQGYPCVGGIAGNQTMTTRAAMFSTWVPGTAAQRIPEGEGFLMEPGQMLIVQVHYNTSTAKPAPDQGHFQLATAPAADRRAFAVLFMDPKWTQRGGMVIPAGAPDAHFTTALDMTKGMAAAKTEGGIARGQAFEIGRVGLHMHTRGKSGRLSLVRANGKEECLVSIPDWDFSWQEAYNLKHPVIVQPGDKLQLTCHFDNSGKPHLASSRHDPNAPVAPPTRVEWGEGTNDEMCMALLLLSTPKPNG